MDRDDQPSSAVGCRQDSDPFAFNPAIMNALLVTHAHDDHCARIIYLVDRGLQGPIHMTAATARLFRAKLDDALYYSELPNMKQKAVRDEAISRIGNIIVEHRYLEPFDVTGDAVATFVDAGHIPGSASVVLDIDTSDGIETITFSGDVGTGRHPFLNQPDMEALRQTATTTLVMESTYGASPPRDYPADMYGQFYASVQQAVDDGKLVVIPAFALDRTQVVLAALLDGISSRRLLLPRKIGVGGKSSYYLTEEYIRMHADSELCSRFFSTGSAGFCEKNPFAGRGSAWEFVRESVSDTSRETPLEAWNYSVIVTPSGTGSSSYAAELIHAYEGDPRVVFAQVGWVPPESPLAQLATSQGATKVLDSRSAFSGHADITGLLEYVRVFPSLERVIITHGDDSIGAREKLAAAIAQVLSGIEIIMPHYGESVPLGR